MVKIKKKKLSSEGSSVREKMMERKKRMERKRGGLIYPKEGTLRFRIKSAGADTEPAIEIVQFYMGKELGGIISPATFDEPCPFMEKYNELKSSDEEDDQEWAKKLVPKRKFVLPVVGYKDVKGKEVDPEKIDKGLLVSKNVYNDIIDLYLDEDDWGDMTDPINGYDLKLTRSGSGMTDTKYSVSPCPKTKLEKEYREEVDLDSIVRAQILSYDELEAKLDEFLNGKSSRNSDNDEEEDEKPKKKLKKKSSLKRNQDYDDDLPF